MKKKVKEEVLRILWVENEDTKKMYPKELVIENEEISIDKKT